MKERMPPPYGLCDHRGCIRKAIEYHHLFSQTKYNKGLYPEFIHDPRNMKGLCKYHHDAAEHITEQEFCDIMGITPRSKCKKL
jgi:hypothetical protein